MSAKLSEVGMQWSIIRQVRRMYHMFGLGRILELVADFRAARLVPQVKRNYRHVIDRIKNSSKDHKVRVVFLVSDSSKWKLQSVYDRMIKSGRFDPLVAISIFGQHDNLPEAEKRGQQTLAFFNKLGLPCVSAYSYDTHKPIPLDLLSPDIIFYEQPWDIHAAHAPETVSRFAITCYVPYYVPNFMPQRFDYAMPFHRFLFRYFMINEDWSQLFNSLRGQMRIAGDIFTSGHPMLDAFKGHLSSGQDVEQIVIYAPHWTFPHRDNPNALNISTFLWTGRAMLDYAKRHREAKWIFKPHPVLRNAIIKSGVMSQASIDAYYAEWESLGAVCYDSGYVPLFVKSSVMVTDCASFLNEYACTGKPIVRLISPAATAKPCELTCRLYDTYYQVRSIEELEPMLDKIVVRREDPNREARLAAAKAMNLTGVDAAGNIVTYLEKLIWESDFEKR